MSLQVLAENLRQEILGYGNSEIIVTITKLRISSISIHYNQQKRIFSLVFLCRMYNSLYILSTLGIDDDCMLPFLGKGHWQGSSSRLNPGSTLTLICYNGYEPSHENNVIKCITGTGSFYNLGFRVTGLTIISM